MAKFDYEAQSRKKREIISVFARNISAVANMQNASLDFDRANTLARSVVERCVDITPPEETDGWNVGLIVMGQGGFGPTLPSSRRLGNVRYDLEDFISATTAIALASGLMATPYLLPLAALNAFVDLYKAMKVPLSETEAAVAWTMWNTCMNDNIVDPSPLLDLVNKHLVENGRPKISKQLLETSIQKLEMIGFVERPEDDPTKWSLRDWIDVKYK